MLKRPRRFIVIKSIDKAQSLIEKLLGLRITRANRVMEIPQPRHDRHRASRGMRCTVLRRNANA
jgi:hypothetical protein